MEPFADNAPRILILEPDNKVRSTLLRYAVKGWHGAAVQSTSGTLTDALGDPEQLKSFDVLLVGCDFLAGRHGREPNTAGVARRGGRSGQPRRHPADEQGQRIHGRPGHQVGRLRLRAENAARPRANLERRAARDAAPQRAARARGSTVTGVVRLFGYDMRRCLATRDSVSVHVAFSAERSKEVVLKVLHRGRGALSRDANFERLVMEFKLLYDIDDRSVAEIYDFRVTSQYCYIAMEYFPLGHLGTQLDTRLAPLEALHYACEIAHGLSIIHMPASSTAT